MSLNALRYDEELAQSDLVANVEVKRIGTVNTNTVRKDNKRNSTWK